MVREHTVNLTGLVKSIECTPAIEGSPTRPYRCKIKILQCNTAQGDGFAVPLYKVRLNADGQKIGTHASFTQRMEWTPSLTFVLNGILRIPEEKLPEVGDRVEVQHVVATFDKKFGKRFTCDHLIVQRPTRERSPVRTLVASPAQELAVAESTPNHVEEYQRRNLMVENVCQEFHSSDMRYMRVYEAKRILRIWGVAEKDLKGLSRWTAADKVKRMAQMKVANGETGLRLEELSKIQLLHLPRPGDRESPDGSDEELPGQLASPVVIDLKKIYLPEAKRILRTWGVPEDALTNLTRKVAINLVRARANQLRLEGNNDLEVIEWSKVPALQESESE